MIKTKKRKYGTFHKKFDKVVYMKGGKRKVKKVTKKKKRNTISSYRRPKKSKYSIRRNVRNFREKVRKSIRPKPALLKPPQMKNVK
tara:strand:+ start:587 stop:844 length:258 start_codon:yes stop_codon:yes gene_type:complete